MWAIVDVTNIQYTIRALLCSKFVCMWHSIAIGPQRKKEPASAGLYILQTPARRWKNTLYNMIWNIAKTCCINFILLSADVSVKLCSWFNCIISTNRLNQYQNILETCKLQQFELWWLSAHAGSNCFIFLVGMIKMIDTN